MAPAPPWIPTPRVSWIIKPAVGTQLPALDDFFCIGWKIFWACEPIPGSDVDLPNHPFYRTADYYPIDKEGCFGVSLQELGALDIWRSCIRKCLTVYHAETIDPDEQLGREIIEELSAPQQFEDLAICYGTDDLMLIERGHQFSTQGEFRARSFLRMIGAILEQHQSFVTSQYIRRLIQGSVDQLVAIRLRETPPRKRPRRRGVNWSRLGDVVEEKDFGWVSTDDAPPGHRRGQPVSLGGIMGRVVRSMENFTLNPGPTNPNPGSLPAAGGTGTSSNGSTGGPDPGASSGPSSGPTGGSGVVLGAGPEGGSGNEHGNEAGTGSAIELSDRSPKESDTYAQSDGPSDLMDIDDDNFETASEEYSEDYTLQMPEQRDPWEVLRDLEFSDERETIDDTRIPFPGITLSSTLKKYDHSVYWPDRTRYFTPPNFIEPILPRPDFISPLPLGLPLRQAANRSAADTPNVPLVSTISFDVNAIKSDLIEARALNSQPLPQPSGTIVPTEALGQMEIDDDGLGSSGTS
ncbi:hypothetical protein TWF192_007639 [Orbilia oligospora]|uniref:Uncharacterized protein n=1 Tax=Orbilia oligospora TaxID=2813651 RepID=A0A6G1M3S1_ORBOL|nr:hypothetical protein TWF191_003367 [Orbilia oligospora]KAF3244705.1 hypothetical protein TWF192_007639 [Orbilia oligospora]